LVSSRSPRPTGIGLPLREFIARTHSPELPQLCIPGSTYRRAFARFPFRGSAALSALLHTSPFALTGCPLSDSALTQCTAFPPSGFDPLDGLLLARRCRPISSDLHSQGSAPSEVFPHFGRMPSQACFPSRRFCLAFRHDPRPQGLVPKRIRWPNVLLSLHDRAPILSWHSLAAPPQCSFLLRGGLLVA
jgi:hypothetical protein